MWDLNESVVPVKLFAQMLCDDLELPPSFLPQIISSMDDQIAECTPFAGYFPPNRRVLIKLEIQVGSELLTDQFEWELSALNSPEEFAKVMCSDLGLGGEFASQIAFSIREQSMNAIKVRSLTYLICALLWMSFNSKRTAYCLRPTPCDHTSMCSASLKQMNGGRVCTP